MSTSGPFARIYFPIFETLEMLFPLTRTLSFPFTLTPFPSLQFSSGITF